MKLDFPSPKSAVDARTRGTVALLLLTCAACGSSSSDTVAAPDAGDASPAVDAGVDSPPPVTPDAGAPDARPPTPQPPIVRDCGVHATTAKPLRSTVLVPKLKANAVSLGEGLDVSMLSPATGVAYVTGNVSKENANAQIGNAGDDVVAEQMFPFALGSYPLFEDGGNPVTKLATTIASDGGPDATATTYSIATSRQGEVWTLTAPMLTADAPPPSDVNAAYVGALSSTAFFGYAIGIQFDSPCGMAALGDALGTKAKAANVLADPSSALVRKTLIENGAQLTVLVVANKPHPAVAPLLAATTCAADDLPACKQLWDALRAEEAAWVTTPSTDFAGILGGTDPVWSFVAYDPTYPLPGH